MSKSDFIKAIELDQQGRLRVYPASLAFPYIYREAMEVHWDADGSFLYSPRPREWTYADWFFHILKAAKAQAASLYVSEKTNWLHVPENMKQEILHRYESASSSQ